MGSVREAYLAARKRKNCSKKHAEERRGGFLFTIDDTTLAPHNRSRQQNNTVPIQDSAMLTVPPSDTEDTTEDKIIWSSKRYIPLELFPHMLGDDPDQPPTQEEIDSCNSIARGFKYFDHGKVVIHDKLDKSKIIALIEFTSFDDASLAKLDEITTVTNFLHSMKHFVNAVGSEARSWGGKMFAIGWRKAMVAFQLLGLYRNKAVITRHPEEYNQLMERSSHVSSILGRMFRRVANVAFSDNQELMQQYSIPLLGHPDFDLPIGKDDCAPNLTFTAGGFFNPPHCDRQDLSEFAFGLFLPVNRHDWSVPTLSTHSNLSGGAFVFPDYRCGIDFSKHHVFVKLVWRAHEVRHCTLHLQDDLPYDRLGLSLQINKKTATTSQDTKSGAVFERPPYKNIPKDKLYIGNLKTYVKGTH
ncbi:uncharacterized protein PGTG_17425 [Puccinia graminis f. sp. tritici CRL 75-36-700-3]|uniref:Tet-like 2OG-Fe(II) oxygenase domain-containing protein n=1 Tax=Puccinia graminis f. sp. tritici (strain CRL 75-36-700-3 / race SCCL) TaxID=418459 RepID=E3L6E5_PUCGT|nr:uncharacterized protein PGTG_17425 [Puccinia graminis f. sp. tritici CRL 75-36-700-3]EFP92120.1 hypothetical protein PGTG_17425 [Puccinia graminis f. sp. tritici CRL 75-36-700-3]